MPAPSVIVCGPASWNHVIVLDRLPEPVPHMQFARQSVHTVGGTSAGKAVHLASLGVATRLHALLALGEEDADGVRVAAALRRAGVDLVAHASADTERHVNLMTPAGERVSLYVSTPSDPDPASLDAMLADLRAADVAVVDLSALGAALLARRDAWPATPLWVDLHDYDGVAAFHEPFLRAADVVFMNADATDDPWRLLASCRERGPRVAVCTLGADGAIALDAVGRRHTVAATPATVVDTNGAGDAFFAGFLAAALAGAGLGGGLDGGIGAGLGGGLGVGLDVPAALTAGAAQAVVALSSSHLHPALAGAERDGA